MRLFLFGAVMLLISCSGGNTNSETEEVASAKYYVEVGIQGMTCTGCESTVESELSSLANVVSVEASHVDGNAILGLNTESIDSISIKEKISSSGYSVVSIALK